jgi:hypothetical protein
MKIIIDNNNDNIDNNYSLPNLDNYNKNLNDNINEIVKKYWSLLINYLKCILEKLKSNKNTYTKFIIIRGVDTITNVFNTILFYTKNLDLTYYHSQKAYYYYIEFIQQITEDQHVFLQLSSRDATTYVYKKNIFELNPDITKSTIPTHKELKNKLVILNKYTRIFKYILESTLQNFDLEKESLEKKLELVDKLDIIYEHFYLLKLDESSIQIIQKCFELIYEINIKNRMNELYLDTLFTFLKRCSKNTSKTISNLEKNISNIIINNIRRENPSQINSNSIVSIETIDPITPEYLLKYFFS